MGAIKGLMKDTAVYGLSSIIGRFLNWCLVPLYTYLFPAAEYGIVSFLYSFTAVALVILNYGMETGFFRYANRDGNNPETVYTTSLISVGTTSLLFMVLITVFLSPVSDLLQLPAHPEYVWLMGITVAIDAFTNLPFVYLRFKKIPFRFALIKLLNVFLNISLNLFFLLACPWLMEHAPATVSWFYVPMGGAGFGIGWIFFANLLSTIIVLCALTPQLTHRRYRFNGPLLRRMLSYSWPLLVLGIAGILSQNMGQMLMPYLFPGQRESADAMVGIYAANMKIAIVMVMFTQAFRYAYEPFIFAEAKEHDLGRRRTYADATKYFVLFGLVIFLGVMYYLPVLRHFIAPAYWEGLAVVPIMMAAELCAGVFFNLSLWYKLTDRTRWGMYLSLICFAVMFTLNVTLVRAIGIPGGYIGAAWAALGGYFTVMVISYFLGQKYYPIRYPVGRLGGYVLLAAAFYGAGTYLVDTPWEALTLALRTLLLIAFVAVIVRREHVPIPRLLRHHC
ncbi:MAG: oligosaccharide flippase family protein [Bacteroidales bacterium]|nr:oligosaccharide flippase family protein [Bacteroidales bacterium]